MSHTHTHTHTHITPHSPSHPHTTHTHTVAVPDISSLNATPEITSVLLTWTPTTPPNTTTTFQVRYYHLSFPEREVRVGVANPSYQAVGLLPRGRYHFEVRQVTDIGVGGAESVDVRLTENIREHCVV